MVKYDKIKNFMIRTPSFPIELFYEKLSSKDMHNDLLFSKDEEKYKEHFYESINVASRNLFETLENFDSGKKIRDKNYFLNSIYKYLIRSSSRCTPFGLFSSVAFGRYGDSTSFELEDNSIVRYAKPDFEWLYKLIDKIESENYEKLRYTVNEGIFIKKKRAVLLNFSHDKEYLIDSNDLTKNIEYKNVSYTKAMKLVLNIAVDIVDFSTIREKLSEFYPSGSKEFFDNYIISLIKNEYLISDLRVPITGGHQLDFLIKKLEKYKISNKELCSIRNLIDRYNTEVGSNIHLYNSIINDMSKLQKSKYYLSIDCGFKFKNNKLDEELIKELNELLDLYFKFNSQVINKEWLDYKNKFIGRYGNREVPILEATDRDLGVGYPQNYTSDKSVNTNITENPFFNQLRKYFAYKYENAIKTVSHIKIDKCEINKIFSESYDESKDNLPRSLEIKLMYMLDRGQPIYIFYDGIGGSTSACKSYGRFSHMMNDSKGIYRDVNEKILSADDYITCEITCLPSQLRNANVMYEEHASDYEIALSVNNSKNSENRISLDDVVVGIDYNNNFYLKSKSKNKFIIPRMGNMYNKTLLPLILRFLSDINEENEILWYVNPWNSIFASFTYIPEIRYNNFIIQPETWNLSKKLLNLKNNKSFDDFKSKFWDYKHTYNVSKYVYLTEMDNRLLLNLENERCLYILYSFLFNESKEITLQKFYSEFKQPVKYEDSSYCCELYIPLIKNDVHSNDKIKSMGGSVSIVNCDIDSFSEERLITPFNNWLCFNIYGVNDEIDTLLGIYVRNFLGELLKQNKIKKYFYIRYTDTENHVRLRLNAAEQELFKIYPEIKVWFDYLVKDKMISHYTINCYDREIERYGGIKLIESAEQIFFTDSQASQDIIKLKCEKKIPVSDELIGVISMFMYMQQFGLDVGEMYDFLDCKIPNKIYRTDFKKNRMLYINTIISLLKKQDYDSINELVQVLYLRDDSIRKYVNKFDILYKADKTLKYKILDSFIHMAMNRLFGPNLELERKIRSIVRHTVYAVNSMNQNTDILSV